VAYQASLMREEDRPVRFRLFVGPPSCIRDDSGPPEGLLALSLTEFRPYQELELRRLAPAAKYHRALIGVCLSADSDDFRIWGVVQSGPGWLQSARRGRAVASPMPTDSVVVQVAGPGQMAVRIGDVTLVELRGGTLITSAIDVFESRWLTRRFVAARAELADEHDRAMGGRGAPLEPNIVRRASQQMFRRMTALLREAHHGGTLLIVPDARAPALLGDGGALRLKYAFAKSGARVRHRVLLRSLMRELALAGAESVPPAPAAGFRLYQTSPRPVFTTLEEGMLEVSQLLGALGDVDGAVVVTDRFELLGFGAEITGPLPEIDRIRHALDVEAESFESVGIDGVGTRHRSAYRLCALEQDALAIVVSHDGGVQFVAWHDGALTYWEHLEGTPDS
jgi:hypothetical protein